MSTRSGGNGRRASRRRPLSRGPAGDALIHRGGVHTPAVLALLGGGALLLGAPRRVLGAFAVGFRSNLVVDTFASAGIAWLSPVSSKRVSLEVPIHGAPGTAVFWLASLSLALFGPRIRRRVRSEE